MQMGVLIKPQGRKDKEIDRMDGRVERRERGNVLRRKLERGTESIRKEEGRKGENQKAGKVPSAAIHRFLWPEQNVTVLWASSQMPGGELPLTSPECSSSKPTVSAA